MRNMDGKNRWIVALALTGLGWAATACEAEESSRRVIIDASAPSTNDGGGGAQGGQDAGGGSQEGPAELSHYELEFEGELNRYGSAPVRLVAVYSDASREPLTGDIEWTSADPSVISIDDAGLAQGVHTGTTEVTASWGDQTVTQELTVGCRYPNFPNTLRYNSTMPALGWQGAKYYDISGRARDLDFSFESFYCDREWDGYDSMVVMIKAAWCLPCTQYAKNRLNPEAPQLMHSRALTVYMEAQETDGNPADNAYADMHMRRLIGDGYGVRVGDASTLGTTGEIRELPAYIQNSPIVEAFPTVLVVRKSDMRIIADSSRAQFYLPLLDIVKNLNADWSDPRPNFVNKCEPDTEEDSEPNDTPEQAAPLSPGSVEGGLCNPEPDFFRVTHTGGWTVRLDFDQSVGDLDLAILDAEGIEVLTVSNQSTTTNSYEELEWSGPAVIQIFGYNGASGAYTLTYTEAQ